MSKNKTIDVFEKIIEVVIYFIIVIKILFLITSVVHLLLSHVRHPSNKINKLDDKFLGWKSKTEFIFTILMSCLLIFIYTPWRDNTKYITGEMKFLFYLFGFILIFGANWELVMPSTSISTIIQSTIG